MKKKTRKYIPIFIIIIAILAGAIAINFLQTTSIQQLSSNAVGDITRMLSVPEEAIAGQTVVVRVLVTNTGGAGLLTCIWYNYVTGEELDSQNLNFPEGRAATFTSNIQIPAEQTNSFIVKAEVKHDSIVDDSMTLTIPVTVVSHRVFITVLDNTSKAPIEGARVGLGANEEYTDFMGMVDFSVSPGTYWVGVFHSSYWFYQSSQDDQIVVSNADVERTIYLNRFIQPGQEQPEEQPTEQTLMEKILSMIQPIYIAFVVLIIVIILLLWRFWRKR